MIGTSRASSMIPWLTDKEREALEAFWRKHEDCQHKYPKGSKGWDFAYEILPGICGADDRDLKVTCLRCGESAASIDGEIVVDSKKPSIQGDSKASMVLHLLHERGSRDIRSETIGIPDRYYDVVEAIGYVRGLIDALMLTEEDGQLESLFQHVIARLVDEDESGFPAELKDLIREASDGDSFDWVIEDAMPFLKRTLKDDFNSLDIEWVDEVDIERG